MAPDPETTTRSQHSEGAAAPPRRRGRRGGRGRGRRSRPPRPPAAELAPTEPVTGTSPPTHEAAPRQSEVRSESVQEPKRAHSSRPLQQAIDEVNHIVQTLTEALEDMEEVLETLELAERQQNADQQEVETLRRALHQLRRPRDDRQRSPRGDAPSPG